ncbi:MAG: hypothetical protein GC203_18000 [Phenylobacterium sp.]|uniref:DUF6134 family protein n=1 Tax=Phenylobacterium sp. TaxID=1871053 RepID=UPI0025E328C2|nr:DUF6134 family protein [Phenylobacterium sp.]MBI1199755.1 hypothetical protein [Phenylobacterium sp.]
MTERLWMARRELIAGAAGLVMAPGAALAAPNRLAFQVFRNGTRVGDHQITFTGDDAARTVTTDVTMVVKLGPVPVFKYRHKAVERWAGGKWASVETSTNSNGKMQTVSAQAMGGYVQIDGPAGSIRGPADAVPLSHWNQASFGHPLFNQQEGKMLKVRCSQVAAGHWAIRGETEIDDFYDAKGDWMALKGKLDDGSTMEYRRV